MLPDRRSTPETRTKRRGSWLRRLERVDAPKLGAGVRRTELAGVGVADGGRLLEKLVADSCCRSELRTNGDVLEEERIEQVSSETEGSQSESAEKPRRRSPKGGVSRRGSEGNRGTLYGVFTVSERRKNRGRTTVGQNLTGFNETGRLR